jgi:transposase
MDQLRGQLSRSGQYFARRSSSDATIRAVCKTLVQRPMLLTRLLNACYHFPGFVYERACLGQHPNTIEVQARPRRGSKPHCSSCQRPAPGYDRLAERRFEFISLWGHTVLLLYCMRRVDCRHCGVRVEQVPWGRGKHTLTEAYMLFLAHWARKLSWQETARAFHTSWDKVYQAVEYVV